MKLKLSTLVAMIVTTQTKEAGIDVKTNSAYGKSTKGITPLKAVLADQKALDFESCKLRAQPQESDSPDLQAVDYRIGDCVDTFEEYQEAVKDYYECEANYVAKEMPVFRGNSIVIYGEEHLDTKIPSLRGESGSLLLESGRPDLCELSKYNEPGITCQRIETDLPETLITANINCQNSAIELLNKLDPTKKTYNRIASEISSKSKGHHEFLAEVDTFVTSNGMQLYQNASEQRKALIMSALDNYKKSKLEISKAYDSTEMDREKLMVKNIARKIKKLGEKASINVVVGDNHAGRIGKQLKKKFTDRPVVTCRLKA